ncbi:MAG TPA: hypothetical protein DCZ94_03675 [Lentisphaeria bacterium]|nr:MAG: hypothetical protein A2X48_02300 [Lentisphaerae bacterium GWF2_49_21]HBC86033.1 hypothetical protein [Lentisphaeria bacterium]
MKKNCLDGVYQGENLSYLAFPMGGIGAGMICLDGNGAFSDISIKHQPDILTDSSMFAAVCVKDKNGNKAKVLEGPVPNWKIFGRPEGGKGLGGRNFGLPRFSYAEFHTKFPFGTVKLQEKNFPVSAEITGWSPFIPGDADNSSLPVAGLEYTMTNKSTRKIEAVWSFHAFNFLRVNPAKDMPSKDAVLRSPQGFILNQESMPDKFWTKGAFCAETDARGAKVDCAMFRGGWFDPMTLTWKNIESGSCLEKKALTSGDPSPGGSLYVPFSLAPGKSITVKLKLSWFVPYSNVAVGKDSPSCSGNCNCESSPDKFYQPWYSGRFKNVGGLSAYWHNSYAELKKSSMVFAGSFYDSTLPPEILDAIAANLAIMKSPTVLRQKNGSLWGWEGCNDNSGCCYGSCTHVWNYAQAIPHLFPSLEQSLRNTEFKFSQDEKGHQNFRSSLPIRTSDHNFHAASDGQLGGIMKIYREWRISGDSSWLKGIWPEVRNSLDFCIEKWDPDHRGVLVEPHHNTYDIEFWGPDGMCSSFYLGALKAAIRMGEFMKEDVSFYSKLYTKGRSYLEKDLFNGEYFYQKVQWKGLKVKDPTKECKVGIRMNYSKEATALLKKEGPKYQYGKGCLSDGVLGAWLAEMCGLGEILDDKKVKKNLASIYKYNYRKNLKDHANPQRPGYALGNDGGLLLCTWPKGDALTLPFPYSNEVWTGYEYQVASHLLHAGEIQKGLEIVRAARRRYDGRVRNPFNEYECGHFYARAMSSYGLIQGITGVRYDAVEKVLYISPKIKGDFKTFFCAKGGFGTVGVKNGKPFAKFAKGKIEIRRIEYNK